MTRGDVEKGIAVKGSRLASPENLRLTGEVEQTRRTDKTKNPLDADELDILNLLLMIDDKVPLIHWLDTPDDAGAIHTIRTTDLGTARGERQV